MRKIIGKLLPIIKAKIFTFRFVHCGKGCRVHGKPFAVTKQAIYMGDRCTINHGVMISGGCGVIIGNDVRLSNYCQIQSGSLNLKEHYKGRKHIYKPISIHDGVWVCAGAIITGGVTLGEGCVIGANSVVTKDIPPFELWAGSPAKFVRKLNDKETN